MSSDQIDPADQTERGRSAGGDFHPDRSRSPATPAAPGGGDGTRDSDLGPSECDVVERLQQLWTRPADKSPSPFVQTSVDQIDRFEIIRVLGEGGMGRVYLAIDSKIDRKVAIKVPLFDSDTDPTILERFRREGRAAGAINHPNVVAVYEVGDTDQGCYIVSEYVQGPTLREYLRRRDAPLTARAAAALMLAVARGVQVAHQQGVIHRDLKPSNVLLEQISSDVSDSHADNTIVQIGDDVLRPRVADFGLAGFVDGQTAITMSGALVGTPSYMAPEQITGTPLGPPSDVFSLGVMLYESITGSSPFAAESYVATIDRIQNHDPQPLTKTNSSIPADLSAICECAISKEPARRYSTAGELADDLARYLAGQPVRARSLGPLGRFQRWVRRYPARAALAGVIGVALVWSLIQNGRLTRSTAELQTANAKYRETIYVQDMIAAFDALHLHATDETRSLLERYSPESTGVDQRGIEWYALHNLVQADTPIEVGSHEGEVFDIAVAPDGRHFFSVGEDRRRKMWDLENRKLIRESEPELVGRSRAIAISPDGKTFVTGGNDLMAHDMATGSIINPTPITHHDYDIRAIAISPDGQLVASLCLQDQIHLNSLNPEIPYANRNIAISSQRCTRIDFSPDGRQLYFTKQFEPHGKKRRQPRHFVAWDVESGKEVFSSPSQYYSGYFGPVDASGDGNWVAIGGFRHVQLYDSKMKRFHTRFLTTQNRVLDVEFSPDNSCIAVGMQDGTLITCRLNQGLRPVYSAITSYRTRPYNDAINSVAWLGNEKILTGDDAGRILLHSIDESQQSKRYSDAHICQLDESSQRLLVIDRKGIGTLQDLESNQILCQLKGLPNSKPGRVRLGPNNRYLAIAVDDRCQVWDLNKKVLHCEIKYKVSSDSGDGETHRIKDISISPDSRNIAMSGDADGHALIGDLGTGAIVQEFVLPKRAMAGRVSYSPFGKYLLCTSSQGGLLVDLDTGDERPLDVGQIRGIQWTSPTELLLNGESGLLAVYNVVSGEFDSVLSRSFPAFRLATSPDLQTLVTGSKGLLHFWHLPTRRLMGSIPMLNESIAFSPDGDKLYVTGPTRGGKDRRLCVIGKETSSPRLQ